MNLWGHNSVLVKCPADRSATLFIRYSVYGAI